MKTGLESLVAKISALKRNVGALSHVMDSGVHRLAENRLSAFKKCSVPILLTNSQWIILVTVHVKIHPYDLNFASPSIDKGRSKKSRSMC